MDEAAIRRDLASLRKQVADHSATIAFLESRMPKPSMHLGSHDTNDPLLVVDGHLWYRSDTDRIRARSTGQACDIPMIVQRQVGNVAISNSNAETAVLSYSVPGGMLSTDRELFAEHVAVYGNNSGAADTVQVKVTFGGTVIYNSTTAALAASATAFRAAYISVKLIAHNSTSAQRLQVHVVIGNATFPATGTGSIAANSTLDTLAQSTASEDSTATKTLEITVTLATAASTIQWIRRSNTVTIK